jgi:hypothetical protein
VYLHAGKRVDQDEYWDPVFGMVARRKLKEINRVYGPRMVRALTRADVMADHAGREVRDRAELRLSR